MSDIISKSIGPIITILIAEINMITNNLIETNYFKDNSDFCVLFHGLYRRHPV